MRVLSAVSLLAVLASAGATIGAAPRRVPKPSPKPAPSPPLTLVEPNGLALATDGTLFISDIGTHRVVKLDRSGALIPVAGTGAGGFNGDGVPATRARLNAPHDLAFDADGNLLIADTYNHRIRRIKRNGLITTVAGDGSGKLAGDNGPALKASLNNPQGIALDRVGNLYIADTYNHVVRRVDAKGIITTFAGTEAGLAGDGGPANQAQISLPMAVAVAPDGSLYISDAGNNRVRRVNLAGVIETVLGFGPGSGTAGAGFAGDGGPPAKARIFAATDLKFNPAGDLFVSDSGNNRVRRVSKEIITTLVGTGIAGFAGDGGAALNASLNTPQKIFLVGDGSIYIADRINHRVRRVTPDGHIESVRIQSRPPSTPITGREGRRRSGEVQ